MEVKTLQEKLKAVKEKGYVVSLRKGNTGIGYTLETLLGIAENNIKLPDFGTVESLGKLLYLSPIYLQVDYLYFENYLYS